MRGLALRRTWPFALWLIVLALVPWWLGLPLLLGIGAALLVQVERLHAWQGRLRLSLRWGLPGVAFALGHGFAEAALGWTVTAVAALAGFTLLAGLEAWLDRHRRAEREAAAAMSAGEEWPQRVMSPAPAGRGIIELAPPRWHACAEGSPARPADQPRGQPVYVREEGFAGFRFDDGSRVEAPPGRCAIDPDGRWLAVEIPPGVLLWDRQAGRAHHLRRRSLCGWYAGHPWLQSGPGEMPVPLDEALRREPSD